jgi:hypothetical protein
LIIEKSSDALPVASPFVRKKSCLKCIGAEADKTVLTLNPEYRSITATVTIFIALCKNLGKVRKSSTYNSDCSVLLYNLIISLIMQRNSNFVINKSIVILSIL